MFVIGCHVRRPTCMPRWIMPHPASTWRAVRAAKGFWPSSRPASSPSRRRWIARAPGRSGRATPAGRGGTFCRPARCAASRRCKTRGPSGARSTSWKARALGQKFCGGNGQYWETTLFFVKLAQDIGQISSRIFPLQMIDCATGTRWRKEPPLPTAHSRLQCRPGPCAAPRSALSGVPWWRVPNVKEGNPMAVRWRRSGPSNSRCSAAPTETGSCA